MRRNVEGAEEDKKDEEVVDRAREWKRKRPKPSAAATQRMVAATDVE
jgi:hypothetical protein